MNLHNARFATTNVAIWLNVWGRNGRGVGTHLWPIHEGTPPTEPEAARAGQNLTYWVPQRFRWEPFSYRLLFRDGWVRPLCGVVSRSARPSVAPGSGGNGCEECLTRALNRGIVPLTYNEARDRSMTALALQDEMRSWSAAGRPSPWPRS